MDLSLDSHQSLHKVLDLKQLDTKLTSFYKTHTLEFVRSEETTQKQYKLLADFFTNYDSKKAKQIDQNPKVAALFTWLPLERQIKIEGSVEKISKAESLKYFLRYR